MGYSRSSVGPAFHQEIARGEFVSDSLGSGQLESMGKGGTVWAAPVLNSFRRPTIN